MYYVDPYMFAGHFYEPWPAFEYEYRYPWPGIGSGAVPGSGGGSGPGIGGGAVPGFGGGSGPGIGSGASPGFGGAPQGPPPSQIPAKPLKPQGSQGAVLLVEPNHHSSLPFPIYLCLVNQWPLILVLPDHPWQKIRRRLLLGFLTAPLGLFRLRHKSHRCCELLILIISRFPG